MSSLLRARAIRRAFSAASPRGQQGASFLRAPAPAVGGEATVRRGPGLPTLLRRRLSEQTATPSEEVLLENMKELQANIDKGFIICGSIRAVIDKSMPRNPFVQWAWMVGVLHLLISAERTIKSVK